MSTAPAGDDVAPTLTVAAVARRLGIAPATLRTWDRRYGLGPAVHAPGAHRRYGAADLARLELMQQALVRGVTPAEAARLARAAVPSGTDAADAGAVVEPVDTAAEPGAAAALGVAGSAAGPDASAGTPGPASRPAPPARVRAGGRALRMPRAGLRAHGVARAALALDAATVRQLLDEAVAADGLIRTWDEVVRPVLVAVVDRWASTGVGVEVEHLVSEAVAAVYAARACAAPPPAPGARPVLLASAPGEWHHLPLSALAAVLAEAGVPARPLGPNLPLDALVAAVRRTAPAAVVLWAHSPATADPGLFAALPRTRPGSRSFATGPGWTGVELPPRIGRPESLAGAADILSRMVGITHTH